MARPTSKRSTTPKPSARTTAVTAQRARAAREQVVQPQHGHPRKSASWGLTPGEFAALPPDRRAELHQAARQERHQVALTVAQLLTTMGVIAGLILTGLGLSQTAQSIEESRKSQKIAQDSLDLSRKGQANDRFTKAVEQLGSDQKDVKLGGIYALEKTIWDSPDYHQAVLDVLAAYLREHDPDTDVKSSKPALLATDLQAAVTVLGRNPATTGSTGSYAVDLTGVRLMRGNLSGVNLSRSYMRDATLSGSNLAKAALGSAELYQAGLSNTLLSDADLRRANLYAADLSSALIYRANMSDATLVKANMTDAELAGSNLARAQIYGANLTRANLEGADLTDANLSGANLTHASFSRANLSRVNLLGTTLNRAGLHGANLTGVFLVDQNLAGMDMVGVNLTGANLAGANLSGANLNGARLDRANLNGANLAGAVGLPPAEQLKKVTMWNADTNWP
ncbi:pentapeptide repeat-containing protein [Nonomuraea sp. NPDC003754]